MSNDPSTAPGRIARKDWLLAAARFGTILVRVFLGIGMAAIGVVAAVLLVNGGIPPEGLNVVVEGKQTTGITGAAAVLLAIALVSLILAYDFVTRLAQIIDTVGQGDPFTEANAWRLTRMGWTAIAIQAIGIPAMLLSAWLEPRLSDGTFSVDSDFSPVGLALALVLFILARVFRKGTEMREDLVGTV